MRFLPLSRFVPKELLLLGDRPLIHHAVDEAARAGFDAAVIVISPGKQSIRGYLDDIKPGLPIRYAEQTQPAGLGDAVLCGPPGAPFAVLLPDDVLPGAAHWDALRRAHESTGAAALCLRAVPISLAGRFGMAAYHEEQDHLRIDGLVEKPEPAASPSDLSILGRYIVSAEVLGALRAAPPGSGAEVQLTDGFAAAVDRPPGVVAVRYEGDLYDCGTPHDYQQAVARYAARAAQSDDRARAGSPVATTRRRG
jgi:UTP--glucose-1-phosphate uridylyltransferase